MAGLTTRVQGTYTGATANFAAASSGDPSWPDDAALLGVMANPSTGITFPSWSFFRYMDLEQLNTAAAGDAPSRMTAVAFPLGPSDQIYLGRTVDGKVLLATTASGTPDIGLSIGVLNAAPSFVDLSNVLNAQLASQPSGQYVMVVEKR